MVSHLSQGVHSGTHVEGPVHFIADGSGVDVVPLDGLIGEARVAQVRDARSIGVEELRSLGPRQGERLLFKTQSSARCWKAAHFVSSGSSRASRARSRCTRTARRALPTVA